MALFAIQLVRVVLSCLPLQTSTVLVFNLMIGINQMFNVIIIFVHFFVFYFTTIITSIWLGYRTNDNFAAGLNKIVH